MAPEIFRKAGHGKPVDIWAIGVITYVASFVARANGTADSFFDRYFLLCGYTPFDRDSQYEEMQAIIRGDYKFEPVSDIFASTLHFMCKQLISLLRYLFGRKNTGKVYLRKPRRSFEGA